MGPPLFSGRSIAHCAVDRGIWLALPYTQRIAYLYTCIVLSYCAALLRWVFGFLHWRRYLGDTDSRILHISALIFTILLWGIYYLVGGIYYWLRGENDVIQTF